MKNVIVEKKLSGNRILKILQDEYAGNPRESQDNLGEILYLDTSRYTLGDKAVSKENLDSVVEDKENVCIPVYAYIHGSTMLKASEKNPFSCQWDSGKSGVIYVSKEKIRKEYGKRITAEVLKKVRGVLKAEVEQLSQYLQGNNYGYVLENGRGEEIDSCWGYTTCNAETLANEIQQEVE